MEKRGPAQYERDGGDDEVSPGLPQIKYSTEEGKRGTKRERERERERERGFKEVLVCEGELVAAHTARLRLSPLSGPSEI